MREEDGPECCPVRLFALFCMIRHKFIDNMPAVMVHLQK